MNNELSKVFEQFSSDITECCYDDDGNIIPDNVGNVVSVMNAYSKYLDSVSKVIDAEKKAECELEIAKIKAETDLKIAELNREANFEAAKTRSRGDGIFGLIGVVITAGTNIYKTITNKSNLKALIYADKVLNEIIPPQQIQFIEKKN